MAIQSSSQPALFAGPPIFQSAEPFAPEDIPELIGEMWFAAKLQAEGVGKLPFNGIVPRAAHAKVDWVKRRFLVPVERGEGESVAGYWPVHRNADGPSIFSQKFEDFIAWLVQVTDSPQRFYEQTLSKPDASLVLRLCQRLSPVEVQTWVFSVEKDGLNPKAHSSIQVETTLWVKADETSGTIPGKAVIPSLARRQELKSWVQTLSRLNLISPQLMQGLITGGLSLDLWMKAQADFKKEGFSEEDMCLLQDFVLHLWHGWQSPK